MLKKLSYELQELESKIQSVQKSESLIESLGIELSSLQTKAMVLEKELKLENHEYETLKIESVNARVFATIGDLEDRIQKKHKEAIIAKLKYDDCLQEIADVKQHIDSLRQGKGYDKSLMDNYVKLYNEKLQILLDRDADEAKEIKSFSTSIENLRGNIIEIDEAISIGIRINENLDKIIKFIISAEGWRANSLYFNKEVSREKMDEEIRIASENIRDVVQLYRIFKIELADVFKENETEKRVKNLFEFTEAFFASLSEVHYPQIKTNSTSEFSLESISSGASEITVIANSLSSEIRTQKLINEQRPSMLVKIYSTRNQVQNILNELSLMEMEQIAQQEKLQIQMNEFISKSELSEEK